MHFHNPDLDAGLLGDLKDAGVLDPGVIERIHESMGRPESGSLTDFLLAGAEHIPEKPWVYWLIRRHGCHRFGRVALRAGAESWCGSVPADGNLPYLGTPDGTVVVAVLRPDLLAATAARLAPRPILPAAGTLRELRDLRSSLAGRDSGTTAPPPA